MPARRIAAFDFDGTLSRRDTLVPFLVRCRGALAVGSTLARCAPGSVRAKVSGSTGDLHHRDRAKARILRELFTGRDASWLEEQGAGFAEDLPRRIRPEMLDQLAWHRDQDHEIVIVSASLGAYLRPLAPVLGVDHVIAVELESVAGVLTGEMVGPNVRGPEKTVRLQAWLNGDSLEGLWAYGNSSGDEELLAMADVATWVNRTGRS